jgi:hypothetical protein
VRSSTPVYDRAERGIGVRSLADPLPINTVDEDIGRIAFLLIARFARFTAERATHTRAVALAAGPADWPADRAPNDKIDNVAAPESQGQPRHIAAKAGISKTSLHRYLRAGWT